MIRFSIALLALSTTAFAQEPLNGDAISRAISGNTAIATGARGTPWRQFFAADGSTRYYSGSRPASLGEWRIQGDQYCSLWPPSEKWDCYDVVQKDNMIVWRRDGAEPDVSIVYEGDRTLGPLPDGHPK
ncbi:MAG: hypothetical protein AAF141_09285 [Pseudomonadota bacterium]